MNKIISTIGLIAAVEANFAADVNQHCSQDRLRRLQDHGVTKIIPRAWRSYGGYDGLAARQIADNQAVGMDSEVYLFPCRGKSATDQASSMIS